MIHFDSHAGAEIQIVLIDTVLVAAGIDSREESGLGIQPDEHAAS